LRDSLKSEFAANLAAPVNVEIPVIVAAAPTLRSSPTSKASQILNPVQS